MVPIKWFNNVVSVDNHPSIVIQIITLCFCTSLQQLFELLFWKFPDLQIALRISSLCFAFSRLGLHPLMVCSKTLHLQFTTEASFSVSWVCDQRIGYFPAASNFLHFPVQFSNKRPCKSQERMKLWSFRVRLFSFLGMRHDTLPQSLAQEKTSLLVVGLRLDEFSHYDIAAFIGTH